jgi:hypothetical protein
VVSESAASTSTTRTDPGGDVGEATASS